MLGGGWVDDFHGGEVYAEFASSRPNFARVSQQNGMPYFLFHEHMTGAQDFFVVAFGEDNLLGIALRFVDHTAGNFVGLAQTSCQLRFVGDEIDRLLGDTTEHGRFGNSRRDAHQHARIKRFGNQILAPELQARDAVCETDGVRHILFGEVRQRVGGGELHFLVDGGGSHVERAAEDEGESENVVDLVGIVRASGGDDNVAAAGSGLVVHDFGIRIGHREDDRVGCHGADHLGGDRTFGRESGENVSTDQRFREGPQVGVEREAFFVGIHARGAAAVDDAFCVAEDDVLPLCTQADVVLRACDSGGAGAVEDDANIGNIFANEFERVEQRRAGNDRRAVLIVVEDGDLHRLAQRLFDLETFGGFNVFEVDSTECGFEQLAELDDLRGILAVNFDVEYIDVGEALEQNRFAFHDGFAGEGADVAEAEDGAPVAHDGDEVAASGVLVGVLGILGDLKAGFGHSRGIGEAEIALSAARLCWGDFDLSGTFSVVIIQSLLLADQHNFLFPDFIPQTSSP